MFDQADLDADLLALEVLDGLDAGLADDHVAALAVVQQGDELALGSGRTRAERVGGDDAVGVDLAGRVGVDARQVVEPHEVHVHAGFLEPALLLGDFQERVARPVRVTNLDRFSGQPAGGQGQAGGEEKEGTG